MPRRTLRNRFVVPAVLALLAAPLAAPLAAHAQLGPPIFRGQPSAEDMRRAYPAKALAEHIGGVVVLGCEVAVTGRLERCAVVSETPPAYGFGAAAVTLAGKFLMEPKLQNGRPVPGAAVRIPIVFSLPNQATRT